MRIEVRSPHVSREAVRWDILLARVMAGEPPSLWGPTRSFEPCEEPELRAELARLAGSPLDDLDERALAITFRRHALELMRFMPPSRSAEPSFFTLEGDPVVFAIGDLGRARRCRRRREVPRARRVAPGEPLELDITAARATLVEQRPPLPPGALVLESSPVGAMDTIPIATLRLESGELRAEAISEQRLEQALELVAADFGELVELRSRDVTSVDEALAARGAKRRDPAAHRVDPCERRLVGQLATERMRRWLDEPHQLLDGRTPRQGVAGADRAKVVRCCARSRTAPSGPAAAASRLRTSRGYGASSA